MVVLVLAEGVSVLLEVVFAHLVEGLGLADPLAPGEVGLLVAHGVEVAGGIPVRVTAIIITMVHFGVLVTITPGLALPLRTITGIGHLEPVHVCVHV